MSNGKEIIEKHIAEITAGPIDEIVSQKALDQIDALICKLKEANMLADELNTKLPK